MRDSIDEAAHCYISSAQSRVAAQMAMRADLITSVVVEGGQTVLGAMRLQAAGKQQDAGIGDVLAHAPMGQILPASQPMHKAALLWSAAIWNLFDLVQQRRTGQMPIESTPDVTPGGMTLMPPINSYNAIATPDWYCIISGIGQMLTALLHWSITAALHMPGSACGLQMLKAAC